MISTLTETGDTPVPENVPGYIGDAITHVLSSMCFAEPQYCGAGRVPRTIASKIVFRGEISGTLRVAMNEDLARQLAADFLALDSRSMAHGQANLFVLELTNVLCGEMLASVAPSVRYDVSLPSNETTSDGEKYRYCFAVREDGPDLGVDFSITDTPSE